MNTAPHYRVLIERRSRSGKDFPRLWDRHTAYASNAVQAANLVLGRSRVVALGDLFVSLTVSRIGSCGTKG